MIRYRFFYKNFEKILRFSSYYNCSYKRRVASGQYYACRPYPQSHAPAACYSRTGNTADAEDIVQEAFIRMFKSGVNFANDDHVRAWLIRTTLNLTCDHARRHARAPVSLEVLPDAATYDAQSDLLDAVRALPSKYAVVLHLYYYEGFSLEQIASILHIRPATAGTRLARARKKLKERLEEEL